MGSGVERWRSLVNAHWPDQTEMALCVMREESKGDPYATNPDSGTRGLFQIRPGLWAGYFGVSYNDLYDPRINVSIARKIYDKQGWRAWSVHKRGLC